MENKIINSLWIGNRLSKLELLTLHSFVNNGHEFHLWAYDTITTPLPNNVIVKDANNIIPASEVFSYSTDGWKRKGSYAGFSDIFRYKLLYEQGGWWVDMDVCCLKPFDFSTPYFFNRHNVLQLVGNVMKCPRGSELMKQCYDEAKRKVGINNTEWLLPVEVLEKNVIAAGLTEYINHNVSYIDDWQFLYNNHIIKRSPIPEGFYFIHWQNEMWRSEKYDKDKIKIASTLSDTLIQNNLAKSKHTLAERMLNAFYNSTFVNRLRRMDVIQ